MSPAVARFGAAWRLRLQQRTTVASPMDPTGPQADRAAPASDLHFWDEVLGSVGGLC
jgi:hypothetical protein